jgi:hypothetical protein
MAISFFLKLQQVMMMNLRKEHQKRELHRKIKKASLMIDQMPEWQKRDLNISANDLRNYKHRM